MSRNRLNEETNKVRYLIPYLVEKLGISREELDFELDFTLRLGRQEGKPPIRGGRLDVLVRRGTINLMVVEAKAEGESLTDDDDGGQVISYASLLPQIAPLALVTNGSDYRLFETIRRREIRWDEVDPQRHFQVVTPPDLLAIRDEAFRLFLGYSAANVTAFCRGQVEAGLSQLRGSASDRDKKYIPELFVTRGDLSAQIASFLDSSHPLFVLLGDSGLGKTCSLCNTTESLLNKGVAVLFYRGSTLPNVSLLEAVADDFSWEFAEEETARNLVRRLHLILAGQPLVIVVDAIDEWLFRARMQDLLRSARRLRDARVKIILSCKVRSWEEFSTTLGERTGINTFTYGGEPYRLPLMTRDEFHEAIERYSTFYGVKGSFEDTALEAARQSPFLFRILFQVAERHGDEYLTFSSIQFFHFYYDQLISRLSDPRLGDVVLMSIAGLMFTQNRERLRPYDFAQAVGLEKVSNVLEELLRLHVLEVARTDHEEHFFFYFSLLRDYLVAFRVYQWHQLQSSSLIEVIKSIANSAVQVEALAFFYRYAAPEQKRVIDSSLFERAKTMVELYGDILKIHFPACRDQFTPYTKGEIGVVGMLLMDRKTIDDFAYRELKAGDEKVLLLPLPRHRRSNLLYFFGAKDPRAYWSFEAQDARELVLNMEIRRQLQHMVENGLLDESCCPELASETVAVEVARDRAIFSDKRHAQSAGAIFPLNVSRVRYWLRYELLYQHFYRVCENNRMRSGDIEVNRHEDGSISYSWIPTFQDRDWIINQVEAHVNDAEEEVRQRVQGSIHRDLKLLDDRLIRALNTLDRAEIHTIEDHPFSNAVEHWRKMGRYSPLTMKDACDFIERIYTYALPIIRRMVQHNFPTIAHAFKTLCGPFVGIAAVDLERGRQGATIYLCEPDPGQEDVRFIARDYHDIDGRIVRDPAFRFEICSDGIWRARAFEGFIGQRSLHFTTVFRPRHDYLGSGYNIRSLGPVYPVIRAIVYDWIRQELPGAFDALCQIYGISKRDRDWTFFPQSRN